MPTNDEWQAALGLIGNLMRALAASDVHSQEVNYQLIQEASEFLMAHGADKPKFTG
jgi:hypothetical protein